MSVMTPYRSEQRAGGDGFTQLLRAELTKFRTVRGWVIGTLVGVLLMVGLGVLTTKSSQCGVPPTPANPSGACPAPPTGPGGEWVTDAFYFVRQPLGTSGSITVRVTSLTGRYATHAGSAVPGEIPTADLTPGVQPWAKAGIIIKADASAGSACSSPRPAPTPRVRVRPPRASRARSGTARPAADPFTRWDRAANRCRISSTSSGSPWEPAAASRSG